MLARRPARYLSGRDRSIPRCLQVLGCLPKPPMPAPSKGPVPAPASANPDLPKVTPSDAASNEGPMTRSALVEWLTAQAAQAEPEPAPAQASTDAVPAVPDQTAPTTAPEATEPEAQADTEPDLSQPTQPATEPAESPAGEEDEADTPRVQRRINKMRRELGDAQREIEQLHEQLADLRKRGPEPQPAPPTTALHASQGKLDAERAKLEEALDLIEANPEGLTLGEQAWSAEDLRKERRRLSARLYAIESQQLTLANRLEEQGKVLQAQAEKMHPWLKDRTNPDTQLIENMAAEWPGVARLPGFKAILADAIMYRHSLEKPRPPNAAPAKPAPKTPPAPASAPPPPETRQARIARATDRVKKEGSRDSLIEYLQAVSG